MEQRTSWTPPLARHTPRTGGITCRTTKRTGQIRASPSEDQRDHRQDDEDDEPPRGLHARASDAGSDGGEHEGDDCQMEEIDREHLEEDPRQRGGSDRIHTPSHALRYRSHTRTNSRNSGFPGTGSRSVHGGHPRPARSATRGCGSRVGDPPLHRRYVDAPRVRSAVPLRRSSGCRRDGPRSGSAATKIRAGAGRYRAGSRPRSNALISCQVDSIARSRTWAHS